MIQYLMKKMEALCLHGESVPAARTEGRYLPFITIKLIFSLVSNYLRAQKDLSPEPVELAYFIEPVSTDMTPTEALKKLKAGEFRAI
ncbi:MAG: hypothetical protein RL189_772 [Pseudomonadota bacterium]